MDFILSPLSVGFTNATTSSPQNIHAMRIADLPPADKTCLLRPPLTLLLLLLLLLVLLLLLLPVHPRQGFWC